MPFAVHLDLDPPSAAALTPLIDAVERADPDAMTPRRAQVAPHLSLGVYDRLDAAAMSASLQRFAALQPACDIQLSSLGLFPGPPAVLFAAPVVAAELLDLYGRLHHAAARFVPHCWVHYLPGDWVPHVTLGEGMRPALVPAAIGNAIAAWQPRAAVLNRLSLVRFHPVELLWSTALAPSHA
ncbi:MAG: 2'-5' RNA ligase family protein [Inquilinus sp.]|uniref:2'-5' RNA ligase family protein n=1 Tax=Inquilinus sp. TaxID=1932117 RepID=UPI003F30ACCA